MELSLVEIFKILLKRIFVVISVVVISLVIAVNYCFFWAKPVYSSDASVLIASGALFKNEGSQTTTEYITTAELSTSLSLMKSFSRVLTESEEYYDRALALAKDKGLNNEYSVRSLMGATKISFEKDSIILDIKVNTNDRNDSEVLIAALAECAPEVITSKLGRTSAVVLNVNSAASKVSPDIALIIVATLFGSVVGAIVLAIIIEKLDKTVKGEDDFIKNHTVPLLGCVPDFETKSKSKRRID